MREIDDAARVPLAPDEEGDQLLPPVGEPPRVLVGHRRRGGVPPVGEVYVERERVDGLVARLERARFQAVEERVRDDDVVPALVLEDDAEDRFLEGAVEADPGAKCRGLFLGERSLLSALRVFEPRFDDLGRTVSPPACARIAGRLLGLLLLEVVLEIRPCDLVGVANRGDLTTLEQQRPVAESLDRGRGRASRR